MILLFLLHLVETIFLSTDRNFTIAEASDCVCPKKLFGDSTFRLIWDFLFLNTISHGLQFVDEEIHIILRIFRKWLFLLICSFGQMWLQAIELSCNGWGIPAAKGPERG